jgi:hypothetical protein
MESVFTKLPQDMLQHEINHFLDPLSRVMWNQVLNPDERVYKKFPADYAIKHAIRVTHTSYEAMTNKLNAYIDMLDDTPAGKKAVKKSVALHKRFLRFFANPQNQYALMYSSKNKAQMIAMIEYWTKYEPDNALYEFACPLVVLELRALAIEALKVIKSIKYIRTIPMKKYESTYYT